MTIAFPRAVGARGDDRVVNGFTHGRFADDATLIVVGIA